MILKHFLKKKEQDGNRKQAIRGRRRAYDVGSVDRRLTVEAARYGWILNYFDDRDNITF